MVLPQEADNTNEPAVPTISGSPMLLTNDDETAVCPGGVADALLATKNASKGDHEADWTNAAPTMVHDRGPGSLHRTSPRGGRTAWGNNIWQATNNMFIAGIISHLGSICT